MVMVANSTQNASCDIVGPFDFLAPVNAEQLLSELPEDPQQLVELGEKVPKRAPCIGS